MYNVTYVSVLVKPVIAEIFKKGIIFYTMLLLKSSTKKKNPLLFVKDAGIVPVSKSQAEPYQF